MNSYLASLGPALANHLWQSTAFGFLAWLLTLGLRKNQARVRYAIWLTASIKFLVPFSLLVSMGNLLPHSRHPAAPIVYSAMNVAEEPFTIAAQPQQTIEASAPGPTLRERVEEGLPSCLGTIWLLGLTTVLFAWCNRLRIVARSARQAVRATKGRELEILCRSDGGGLPLLMSEERMEPGVFGVFHPVMVWPNQLSEHLGDQHIEAIIAHELAHVARRDNLTVLIHMLVEAAFWFHPLVWWIERQMVKEREQACDEAVVAAGRSAETYAESLLKTCWFCIESPLPCAAGVTGADLNHRVADIIAGRVLMRLNWPKRLLLAVAVGSAIVAPVVLGQEKAAWRLANVMLSSESAYSPKHAANTEEKTYSIGPISETERHEQVGSLQARTEQPLTLEAKVAATTVEPPKPALIVPAYNEIYVDDGCRVVTQNRAGPGQSFGDARFRTDDEICHFESVHQSQHWEDTVDGAVVKRTPVSIHERTYVLHNPTDQSVTFVVDHWLPAGWMIDSVPSPTEKDGPVAIFRVVGPPGQTIHLHVGERHDQSQR